MNVTAVLYDGFETLDMFGPFENAHEVFFEQSDPRWGRLPYTGFAVS